MPIFLFENNAISTLAAGIGTGDTSITLQSGDGALFPSPAGGDSFRITLADAGNNIEIVDCTSRTGDVLTIVRAQEGTTANAYLSGDAVGLRITKEVLEEFAQNDEAVLRAVAAIKTAGDLTFNDSVSLEYGTDSDVSIRWDNAATQLNIDVDNDGEIHWRDANSGNTDRLTLDIATGDFTVFGLFRMIGGYSEDADVAPASSGPVLLNIDVASYYSVVLTGPLSPTFTFSTSVPSGRVTSFTLEMTDGLNWPPVWPAGTQWPDSTEPVWSAGTDIITFFSRDGGTTWLGFAGGINMG